jgi:hypothetical protein
MPARRGLRIGDRIRLLAVPAGDLAQREREIAGKAELPGWTADTIERILRTDPVVTIDRICAYGHPWFDYTFRAADGSLEEHTLAILDDDSWEYC